MFNLKQYLGGWLVTNPDAPEIPVKAEKPLKPTRTLIRGAGLLLDAVGFRESNLPDDVKTVQILINEAFFVKTGTQNALLKVDGVFGTKTAEAIKRSQETFYHEPTGSVYKHTGFVELLFRSLPDSFAAPILNLIYVNAARHDCVAFLPAINKIFARYEINTPLRKAHFLAQIGHECAELRFREEIASGAAYENRRDLGNTQPGDGKRFKGRGLIQLTGRYNYTKYGLELSKRGDKRDIVANPHLVARDPDLCADVGGWYWHIHNLNDLADQNDLTQITRRINGGFNGLADRKRLFRRARAIITG